MLSQVGTKHPLLIPFIGYLLGLLSSHFSGSLVEAVTLILVLLLIFGVLLLGLFTHVPYSHRQWFGLMLGLAFLTLGMLNHHQFSISRLNSEPTNDILLMRVEEHPVAKEKSYTLKASWLDSETSLSRAKILLYVQIDERVANLQPGNLILLNTRLKQSEVLLNPGEFDFQKYLNTKGIHAQVYVKSRQWKLWRNEQENNLGVRLWRLKKQLLGIISGWPVKEQTKALSMALILGERQAIDRDILSNYASAGGMHVLAVSGLHIGIFYLILRFLFRPLQRFKFGKSISTILILIILWGYAMLTGLSASVVRAVCMFSLMAIGSGMQRKTNIYNTLLASAMLLLIFRPGFLFQVGFQLSYSAVVGIISIYPLLQNAYQPRLPIVKRVWEIVCVSIAAQIGTLPLALYYFHQFPTLFLVTNILVIPLVTLIMHVGILCLTLSGIGLDFTIGFRLLDILVSFMNQGVGLIQLTGTSIEGITIEPIVVALLYLLILQSLRWWKAGRSGRLRSIGFLSMALLFMSTYKEVRQNDPQLVVYYLRQGFAIGAFRAHEGLFIADQKVLLDSTLINHRFRPHWTGRGISEPVLLEAGENYRGTYLFKHGPFLRVDNKSYLLVGHEQTPDLGADTWIVIKDVSPPLNRDSTLRRILLTPALSAKHSQEWRDWAAQLELWDIKTEGPWISG